MAYATAQDFINRFGEKEANQLSNRNSPTLTTPNTDRLDLALEAASGIIDSWLSGRYAVPVAIPQAIEPLRHHCLVLARCDLDNISNREKVRDDCTLTYDWLKRVADGRIKWGEPGLPGQADLNGSTTGARTRAKGCKAAGIDLRGY
jgi:phage gp36-like protein